MHNAELVDHIGVESSIDLKPDVDFDDDWKQPMSLNDFLLRRRQMKSAFQFKEYPPPIPSLSRNNNHPTSIMKRFYTPDGRLIIVEEKIKRREFLQAQRCNGRLVMKLVRDDDDVLSEGEGSGGGGGTVNVAKEDEKKVEEITVGVEKMVTLESKHEEEKEEGDYEVNVGEKKVEGGEEVDVEYNFGGGSGTSGGGGGNCGGFGVAVAAFPPPLHT